jgi:hypothetical protein
MKPIPIMFMSSLKNLEATAIKFRWMSVLLNSTRNITWIGTNGLIKVILKFFFLA